MPVDMSTPILFPILVAPDSPFPLENIPFGIFSTRLEVRLTLIRKSGRDRWLSAR